MNKSKMETSAALSPAGFDISQRRPAISAGSHADSRIVRGNHLKTFECATESHSVNLIAYRNVEDLVHLESSWNDLIASYPQASVFSTSEWLTSWWRSFGAGRQLLALGLWGRGSRLLGFAPFAIKKEPFLGPVSLRVLRFMGDGSGDSDRLDCPVRSGFEGIFSEKIVEFLCSHAGEWDVAELNTMPSNSPTARSLSAALRANRWTSFEGSRYCSAVLLPATWDEYVIRLASEDQKNLVRYERRLRKKYSVRIFRCTREGELPECLSSLFQLHQMRWEQAGEVGTFAGQERRTFYRELAPRLRAKDQLELWGAEINGKMAAVQFAMRHGDRVYQLQEGYDPAHASDRIGFILRAEVLKQLISRGIRVYDFLGGEDEYKSRWAAEAGHYRDLRFARPFTRGSATLNCHQHAMSTKEWLRNHLPSPFWRSLKAIGRVGQRQFQRRDPI